jgi:hypothetical protein
LGMEIIDIQLFSSFYFISNWLIKF